MVEDGSRYAGLRMDWWWAVKDTGPSPSLVLMTFASVGIYTLVAGRLVYRVFHFGVNTSARSFLLGVVISSLALVGVGAAMAYSNRRKPEGLIALVAASVIGLVLCLLFFGA